MIEEEIRYQIRCDHCKVILMPHYFMNKVGTGKRFVRIFKFHNRGVVVGKHHYCDEDCRKKHRRTLSRLRKERKLKEANK